MKTKVHKTPNPQKTEVQGKQLQHKEVMVQLKPMTPKPDYLHVTAHVSPSFLPGSHPSSPKCVLSIYYAPDQSCCWD